MSNSLFQFGIVIAVILLAGCVSPTGGASTVSDTETPAVSDTETPAMTDREVERRALQAEESYVLTHFSNNSCIVYLQGGGKEATVVNRTANGVIVSAEAFAYTERKTSENSSGTLNAHTYTEARYLVTETNTTRLSGTTLDSNDERSC